MAGEQPLPEPIASLDGVVRGELVCFDHSDDHSTILVFNTGAQYVVSTLNRFEVEALFRELAEALGRDLDREAMRHVEKTETPGKS